MKTRNPPFSGSSSPQEGTERSNSTQSNHTTHNNTHTHTNNNHNPNRHHISHPPHQDEESLSRPSTSASSHHHHQNSTPWHHTPSTLLTILSTTIALALMGMGIKLSIKYSNTPLIHVSVAVVVFTAVASLVWSLFECLVASCAIQTRRRKRLIYPGAHVGIHMCLCLAGVAAVGYVCIWVSHGYQWRYVEDELEEEEGRRQVEVDGLYRMGVVVVVLSGILLLLHFVQAMIACQEIRRKEDGNEVDMGRIPVVTVRYDGVGPVGTARPWRVQHGDIQVVMPIYQTPTTAGGGNGRREQPPLRSPPVVIARGDLGVEIVDDYRMERIMTPPAPPVSEKPSRSEAVGSEKRLPS